jgi:hypothetical protein
MVDPAASVSLGGHEPTLSAAPPPAPPKSCPIGLGTDSCRPPRCQPVRSQGGQSSSWCPGHADRGAPRPRARRGHRGGDPPLHRRPRACPPGRAFPNWQRYQSPGRAAGLAAKASSVSVPPGASTDWNGTPATRRTYWGRVYATDERHCHPVTFYSLSVYLRLPSSVPEAQRRAGGTMRVTGFVVVIPVVIIVLAVMVRASRRALEIDLRDHPLGPQEPQRTPSESSRSRPRPH